MSCTSFSNYMYTVHMGLLGFESGDVKLGGYLSRHYSKQVAENTFLNFDGSKIGDVTNEIFKRKIGCITVFGQ